MYAAGYLDSSSISPRFFTVDGSRPRPRRRARSPVQQIRQKPFFRVPGPKSLRPCRVFMPVIRASEEESRAFDRRPQGPNISIARISSSSSQDCKSPPITGREHPEAAELNKISLRQLNGIQWQGNLQNEQLRLDQRVERRNLYDSSSEEESEDQLPLVNQRQNEVPVIDEAEEVKEYREEPQAITDMATLLEILRSQNGIFSSGGRSFKIDTTSVQEQQSKKDVVVPIQQPPAIDDHQQQRQPSDRELRTSVLQQQQPRLIVSSAHDDAEESKAHQQNQDSQRPCRPQASLTSALNQAIAALSNSAEVSSSNRAQEGNSSLQRNNITVVSANKRQKNLRDRFKSVKIGVEHKEQQSAIMPQNSNMISQAEIHESPSVQQIIDPICPFAHEKTQKSQILESNPVQSVHQPKENVESIGLGKIVEALEQRINEPQGAGESKLEMQQLRGISVTAFMEKAQTDDFAHKISTQRYSSVMQQSHNELLLEAPNMELKRESTDTNFTFGKVSCLKESNRNLQFQQFEEILSQQEQNLASEDINLKARISRIADPRKDIFDQVKVERRSSEYNTFYPPISKIFLARRQAFPRFITEEIKLEQRQENTSCVNICFLHASPNLFSKQLKHTVGQKMKEQLFQLPMLNFQKEASTIKKALQESGREIQFFSSVATRSSIEDTIRRRPTVLHISCHGIRNSESTLGSSFDRSEEFGHLLLFENGLGGGELVSAKELQKFMVQERVELDVVFVAACDSQGIGRVFQRCGAKHVVCVEQNRFLLDEAAISFTKTFYCRLLQGEPVCKAFMGAKNAVTFKIHETEADLFLLLLSDTHQRNLQPEDLCSEVLPQAPQGNSRCISLHNLVKQIPARLKKIQFRERDMHKLLTSLLADSSDRIVPLIGFQGVGKSSLARNTLHYVAERKMFTHGVVLVQLKGVKTCFAMLKLLIRAILPTLDLSREGKRNLVNKIMTKNAIIDYLINFFNNKQDEILKKHDRIQHNKQQNMQLFLLCLDNAEEIILNDKNEFVAFLATLYDECPNLHIIVTSFCHFGTLTNQIVPQPFVLQRLKYHDSAQLFLSNCGDVTSRQMLHLILEDISFPLKKFLRHLRPFEEVNQEQKEIELERKLENRQNWVAALAQHDMIKQLMGNPTSIMMIAAIQMNSMIEPNNLVETYRAIKREKNIAINHLDYASDKSSMPRMIENIMALKVAAETSVKLLESTQLDDINLLYFLGCLPGGVTEEQLREMWGHDKLSESLSRLKKLSFLEDGVYKLMLTPTIISYIQDSMAVESKRDYMMCICNYYQAPLYECFKKIARVSDQYSCAPVAANIDQNLDELSARSKPEVTDALKEYIICLCESSDQSEQKNMFEQLQNDLSNIEHCLHYVLETQKAQKNKEDDKRLQKPSRENSSDSSQINYSHFHSLPNLNAPKSINVVRRKGSVKQKEYDAEVEDIDDCSNCSSQEDKIFISDQPQVRGSQKEIIESQSSEKQEIELQKLGKSSNMALLIPPIAQSKIHIPYNRLLTGYKSENMENSEEFHNLGQKKSKFAIKIDVGFQKPKNSDQESKNTKFQGTLSQTQTMQPPEQDMDQGLDLNQARAKSQDQIVKMQGTCGSNSSSSRKSHDSARRLTPLEINYQRKNTRRQTQLIAGLKVKGLFAIQEEKEERRYTTKSKIKPLDLLRDNVDDSSDFSSSRISSDFDHEDDYSNLVHWNKKSFILAGAPKLDKWRQSNVHSQKEGRLRDGSILMNCTTPLRQKTDNMEASMQRIVTLGIGEKFLSECTVSDSSSDSARSSSSKTSSFGTSHSSDDEIEEKKGESETPKLRKSQSQGTRLSNQSHLNEDFMNELLTRKDKKRTLSFALTKGSPFKDLLRSCPLRNRALSMPKQGKRVKPTELLPERLDEVRRMSLMKRHVTVTPRIIQKMESHIFGTKKSQQAPWTPMDAIEKFIVYLAANSYLIGDSNHSVRISQTEFSKQSALFQGNWLRFSALTNMQQCAKSSSTYRGLLLNEAEKSLMQAELVYADKDKGKRVDQQNKNSQGVGLSLFTLGYMYDHFTEHFIRDGQSMDQVKYMAQKLYKEAFNRFSAINHVLGKLVAKQHSNEEVEAGLIDQLSKQLDEINEQNMPRYIRREHGMAISLMTEIVSENPQPEKNLLSFS